MTIRRSLCVTAVSPEFAACTNPVLRCRWRFETRLVASLDRTACTFNHFPTSHVLSVAGPTVVQLEDYLSTFPTSVKQATSLNTFKSETAILLMNTLFTHQNTSDVQCRRQICHLTQDCILKLHCYLLF